MAEVYEKIDIDTLKIINTPPSTESTINRAEIQTKIDHLEIDKQRIQLDIDALTSRLAILDTIK